MAREEKHPEQVNTGWPHDPDAAPVTEFLADHQGAKSPFGDDIELPVPLERHGRHYTVRPPGTPRHDTDFGGDEAI